MKYTYEDRLAREAAEVSKIARRWTGEACTIDGLSAKIVGGRNAFATVTTLDGKMHYEWSWYTVDRIMNRDRAFRS